MVWLKKEKLEDIDLNSFMIRLPLKNNYLSSKMSLETYCHKLEEKIEKMEHVIQNICPHKNLKYIETPIFDGMLITPNHIRITCIDCNKIIDRIYHEMKGYSIVKKKYDEQQKKISEAKETISKLEDE